MEEDFKTPLFSRALLTAVFVGIVATVLSIVFDVFFKETFDYPLTALINVSTLIFGVNLVFVCVGFIYYGVVRASHRAEIIYVVVFILLTAFGVWGAERIHRTADPVVNSQFRTFLSGIIIITGLLGSIAVPLLFHSKKFEKYVV